MRTNKYKSTILSLLKKNHLLSIADIHKKVPDADYSTIFRNIEQLVADGEVKQVVLSKGTTMYEVNDEHEAHDHFVCTDCGEVEAVELERTALAPVEASRITEVMIKGVCPRCEKKRG